MKSITSEFPEDSLLSIEGDLSKCDFSELGGSITEETDILKRNTTHPKQDFLIIPLNGNNKRSLIEDIFNRIGLRKNVLHIQVAYKNNLFFGAYDCFHPECVWIDAKLKETILSTLLSKRIISNYKCIEK